MFLRNTVVFLAVLTLSCKSYVNITQEVIYEISSKLCPYVRFCSQSAYREYNESEHQAGHLYEPCCTQCSCDDDCWQWGNCCPDKHDRNLTTTISFDATCKESHVKGNQTSLHRSSRAYNVIDKCKYDDGNQNNAIRCDGSFSSVNDFIWVSENNTGKIFQNAHCAICNKVENYIPWLIKTNCKNILTEGFENIPDILMSDSCGILNEPPEDLKHLVHKYTCYQDIDYFHCNETGNWEKYDELVDFLCEEIDWPVREARGSKVGKNVFCNACNDFEGTDIDSICRIDRERVTKATFSVLVSYDDVRKAVDRPSQTSSCRFDEIFDVWMNYCRTVRCPIGSTAVHGTCKQVALQIKSISLNVAYYIEIVLDDTTQFSEFEDNLTSIGNLIYDELYERLGFGRSDCHDCFYDLRTVHGNQTVPKFIFWTYLRTNYDCPFEFVIDQAQKLNRQEIPIETEGREIAKVLVKFDLRPYKTLMDESDSLIEGDSLCLPTVLSEGPEEYDAEFRITAAKECPYIELQYHELSRLTSRTDKNHFMSFFNLNETSSDISSVQVCIDKYFAVMPQKSLFSFTKPRYTFLLFLVLVAYYLSFPGLW